MTWIGWMTVFLSFIFVLSLVFILVPIKAEIICPKRRQQIFLVQIYFGSVRVYRMVFFLRWHQKKGPQLLRITGKWKIFIVAPRRSKKKKKNKSIPKEILACVLIEKWNLLIQIGTGDAAWTAMLCGYIQIILDMASCFFFQFFKKVVDGNNVVEPNFERERFFLKLHCIIRIRLADIILKFVKERGGNYASNRKHFRNNDD